MSVILSQIHFLNIYILDFYLEFSILFSGFRNNLKNNISQKLLQLEKITTVYCK